MFKSDEELYFSWYLDELKEAGFVSNWWYEPSTFILTTPVTKEVRKEIKLKTKIKTIVSNKVLMSGSDYTPDFLVQFKHLPPFLMDNLFITKADNGSLNWWVDTKGSFNGRNNNSAITFPLKQKMLYYTQGILVEKIIPGKLFANTFTPEKYLTTPTGKEKKIKWTLKKLKSIC